jgi:hypothetical protein
MWTAEAAQAHGRETEWRGINGVEEYPGELKLHSDGDSPPVVVDRDYVVSYNRHDPED